MFLFSLKKKTVLFKEVFKLMWGLNNVVQYGRSRAFDLASLSPTLEYLLVINTLAHMQLRLHRVTSVLGSPSKYWIKFWLQGRKPDLIAPFFVYI